MSFSIVIRRIQFQFPIARAQLEHFVKHGPIQPREGFTSCRSDSGELNIELSEVTGKLLLKLFSNVWQHHN